MKGVLKNHMNLPSPRMAVKIQGQSLVLPLPSRSLFCSLGDEYGFILSIISLLDATADQRVFTAT